MKKRPLFICFSGIDGSGKTTSSIELLQYLHNKGLAAKYVWLNPRTFFLTPIRTLARKMILRGMDLKENFESYHRQRTFYASRWQFARRVYYGIMLFDYWLWVNWNLLPYRFRGVSIVCDRYIYDLAVNLGDILEYSAQEEIQFIRLMQRVFPQPSLVFVCDVDEQVAFERKNDTPHLSYLTAHRPMYRYIAKEFQFPIVDTSRPLEATIEQVRQVLDTHISK